MSKIEGEGSMVEEMAEGIEVEETEDSEGTKFRRFSVATVLSPRPEIKGLLTVGTVEVFLTGTQIGTYVISSESNCLEVKLVGKFGGMGI